MCRMIAAVGRFEIGDLGQALKVMASNLNPDHDHELRCKGADLQHDCGWGIVYRSGSQLVRMRRPVSCLTDDGLEGLSDIETDLVILHARRAKDRSTISEPNTHPFLTRYGGRSWAFCHNGEVRDTSQLSFDDTLVPAGICDSEIYFFHVLSRIDPETPQNSVGSILADITDFTSLNCFLASPSLIVAASRIESDSKCPAYYTLWKGNGDGLTVISSEVVGNLPCREWKPLPEGAVVSIAAP